MFSLLACKVVCIVIADICGQPARGNDRALLIYCTIVVNIIYYLSSTCLYLILHSQNSFIYLCDKTPFNKEYFYHLDQMRM